MGFASFLTAAAPAIGGALGFLGGERQTSSAKSISREQMSFQERMRATQYQTATTDMRKAGLNPLLAYQQGGAGTPSGAGLPPAQNVGKSAVEGAEKGGMLAQQIKFVKQQTATSAAQMYKIDTEASKITQNNRIDQYKEQIEQLKAHAAKQAISSGKQLFNTIKGKFQ